MQYQFLPNTPLEEADVVIVPFGLEKTVCARGGTKDAPRAILEASNQLEYFDELLEYSPMKYVNVHVTKEIQNKEDSEAIFKAVAQKQKLCITLGGEHSITPFVTQTLLKNKTTVVFLDAHADLRSTYQGDRYSHATPAYHLLKQGHSLVMAGVRSLFEHEFQEVQNNDNITFFGARELHKKTLRPLLECLEKLQGDVYLSIDMDVFDPSFVPSVGTPQPGGLGWYDALDILEVLFRNKNITLCGVDIVELIPESSNVSQIFAAKLIQKIISLWVDAKGFRNQPPRGIQTKVEYE